MAKLVGTTLTGLGYELVDLEVTGRGLMRVLMDKPAGITVEDCELVSNQLTRLFMVEGVNFERLEVSSPGLDRPLKKEADFVRFSGQKAQIKLRMPLSGRKNFVGLLVKWVNLLAYYHYNINYANLLVILVSLSIYCHCKVNTLNLLVEQAKLLKRYYDKINILNSLVKLVDYSVYFRNNPALVN